VPTVKLPIFSPVVRGVDGVELNEENFRLFDGYRTLQGGTTNRPGSLSLYRLSETGAGIDGVLYWAEKGVVIVATGGDLYQLRYEAGVPSSKKLTTTPLLATGVPVSMCVDGTNVYACNGGKIVSCAVDGTAAQLTDTDAPTTATQVAYLDGYILAIDGTNKLYFSDVNNGNKLERSIVRVGGGSS